MGKKETKEKKKKGKNHFKVAVVDIGSNTVRLVSLKVSKKGTKILENNKHICELGNLDADGNIPDKNQELAFKALKDFTKYIKKEKITHIIPVATAAARNAGNGDDFITRAEKKLGHAIRILSAEEEAKMAAFGVIAARSGKGYEVDVNGIVADLGGGSLELARVKNNEVIDGLSTELGTLVLNKQDDPAAYIQDVFDGIDTDFAAAENLFVIGGSWRAVRKTWEETQDGKAHDEGEFDTPAMTCLSAQAARDHLDRILMLRGRNTETKKNAFPSGLNKDAKAVFEEFDSLSPQRANRIFDASLLLQELIEKTGAKNVIFVEAGLREGLVYSYVMQSVLTLEASRNFSQMHTGKESGPDVEAQSNPAAHIGMVEKPEPCTHDS